MKPGDPDWPWWLPTREETRKMRAEYGKLYAWGEEKLSMDEWYDRLEALPSEPTPLKKP